MKADLIFTITGGRLVRSLTVGATNFSEDTANHHVVVPANKRWLVLYGNCRRSDSATISIDLKDSSDNILLNLGYASAATGYLNFHQTANHFGQPTCELWLQAGDYIDYSFGAAQGATGACHVTVIEVDV